MLFKELGEVTVGSSRGEAGRRSNETRWSANLDRPFYVSTHEITNEQYKLYDENHSSGNFQGHSFDTDSQPVVGISWQNAALYANWLSVRDGLEPFYTTERGFVSGYNDGSTGYRLLTEAEWQWLAVQTPGGVNRVYPWGDESTPQSIENFAGTETADILTFSLDAVTDNYVVTAPVGRFPANSRGLFDLGGNVSEWVNDWYQPTPYAADEFPTDPKGPEIGEFHVIRGASWKRGYLPQLRLAYRDYQAKGRDDVGFRLARYAF